MSVAISLEQGQDSGDRGGAHIVEQEKDVVPLDEGDGVVDGGEGIVAVIVGPDDDLTAVDAKAADTPSTI